MDLHSYSNLLFPTRHHAGLEMLRAIAVPFTVHLLLLLVATHSSRIGASNPGLPGVDDDVDDYDDFAEFEDLDDETPSHVPSAGVVRFSAASLIALAFFIERVCVGKMGRHVVMLFFMCSGDGCRG